MLLPLLIASVRPSLASRFQLLLHHIVCYPHHNVVANLEKGLEPCFDAFLLAKSARLRVLLFELRISAYKNSRLAAPLSFGNSTRNLARGRVMPDPTTQRILRERARRWVFAAGLVSALCYFSVGLAISATRNS